jgi:hypothetical protein
MSNYAQLALPEAWRPLFLALEEAGWQLQEVLPEVPAWASRPILCYQHADHPERGPRYLSLIAEPHFCGNRRQQAHFTIVAMSTELPQGRDAAEEHAMALLGDWEVRLGEWIRGW